MINDLTLIVRYVIVFQQIFADIKVVAFNLALSILYGAVYQLVLYGLARLPAQLCAEVRGGNSRLSSAPLYFILNSERFSAPRLVQQKGLKSPSSEPPRYIINRYEK